MVSTKYDEPLAMFKISNLSYLSDTIDTTGRMDIVNTTNKYVLTE